MCVLTHLRATLYVCRLIPRLFWSVCVMHNIYTLNLAHYMSCVDTFAVTDTLNATLHSALGRLVLTSTQIFMRASFVMSGCVGCVRLPPYCLFAVLK